MITDKTDEEPSHPIQHYSFLMNILHQLLQLLLSCTISNQSRLCSVLGDTNAAFFSLLDVVFKFYFTHSTIQAVVVVVGVVGCIDLDSFSWGIYSFNAVNFHLPPP